MTAIEGSFARTSGDETVTKYAPGARSSRDCANVVRPGDNRNAARITLAECNRLNWEFRSILFIGAEQITTRSNLDDETFLVIHLQLVIGDGIVAMEGNGPLNGTPRPLGTIVLADGSRVSTISRFLALGVFPNPRKLTVARLAISHNFRLAEQWGSLIGSVDTTTVREALFAIAREKGLFSPLIPPGKPVNFVSFSAKLRNRLRSRGV